MADIVDSEPQQPNQPKQPAPPAQPTQPQQSAAPEKSVTSGLLKDHAKMRALLGELRAYLSRFDLPGLRQVVRAIRDASSEHQLKEETALFLVGMKFLRADNQKLPELIREHHRAADRLNTLAGLLFSSRMTDSEEQIRQLAFVIAEAMDEHMSDEESVVFPALEKLIDPQSKEIILSRMSSAAMDNFDELDRAPLLSMPELQDNSGLSAPIN